MLRIERNAYMTVEASLIMTTVLFIYLFIIRYALWSYDRCILEQDMAALLLRCSVAEDLERVWVQEKNAFNYSKKKYIWIKPNEPYFKKNGLTLEVGGSGKGGKLENMSIQYKMWCIQPQEWLRLNRKTTNKSKTQEQEGESLE